MKKLLIAAAAVLTLASCSEYSRSDRTLGGALIGGGTGALVGGLATHSGGGAVVGGIIGAGAGAVIGSATTPRACRARWVDGYGNVHYRRVACS